MSAPSYSSARLQRLYAEGRCVTCRQPHNAISKETGRRSWRCTPCREELRIRKRLTYERHALLRKAEQRANAARKRRAPVPPSIYLKHDPIDARLRWSNVLAEVSR